MNESKANKKLRYWLAIMLDDLPIGEVFEPGRLHITIIPWFVTDTNETEVIKSFYQRFFGNSGFELTVGDNDFFEPKHSVSVSLIKSSNEILQLHNRALSWFETINARWAVKNPHVGNDYIPHIRRRQGTNLRPGEIIKVSSLSLVTAVRQEDSKRCLTAKMELKNG